MNNRNTGMIATIASALLCGCPGLFLCFFGATSVFASMVPGADINVGGSSDPAAATTMGVVSLCGSLILIAIPIVVGVVTLRKKPQMPAGPSEPLPPAS